MTGAAHAPLGAPPPGPQLLARATDGDRDQQLTRRRRGEGDVPGIGTRHAAVELRRRPGSPAPGGGALDPAEDQALGCGDPLDLHPRHGGRTVVVDHGWCLSRGRLVGAVGGDRLPRFRPRPRLRARARHQGHRVGRQVVARPAGQRVPTVRRDGHLGIHPQVVVAGDRPGGAPAVLPALGAEDLHRAPDLLRPDHGGPAAVVHGHVRFTRETLESCPPGERLRDPALLGPPTVLGLVGAVDGVDVPVLLDPRGVPDPACVHRIGRGEDPEGPRESPVHNTGPDLGPSLRSRDEEQTDDQ